MARFLLSILFWRVHIVSVHSQGDGVCPIECQNNVACVPGESPYALVGEPTSMSGYFCDCEGLWAGIDCRVPVVHCDYDTEPEPVSCFHGGKCIDEVSGEELRCDCNEALFEGSFYWGPQCEYRVQLDQQCGEEPEFFCLHDGTCRPDYKDSSDGPCECDGPYVGTHCEIKASDAGLDPDGSEPEPPKPPELTAGLNGCAINCLNGGECMEGFSPSAEELGHPANIDGFYCRCALGFAGIDCGTPYQFCEYAGMDSAVHCYNGGECLVSLPTEGPLLCDCGEGAESDGIMHVGARCEIPVEEKNLCDHGSFCVNDGVCMVDRSDGEICDCGSDFSGLHCEFKRDTVDEDTTGEGIEVDEGVLSSIANCRFPCENGGTCVKDKSDVKEGGLESIEDGHHCQCLQGWSGLSCTVPVEECVFQTDDGTSEDIACFNGGKCLPSIDDLETYEQLYCDCKHAMAEGHRFGGKFCEVLVTESDTCDGDHYCLNHGQCLESGACQCAEGFQGPHCELRKEGEKCRLLCENQGTCAFGHGPWGSRDDQYCQCPNGFAGISCEFEAEVCGESEHVCLHGSTCALGDGGDYTCTCEHTVDSFFAGASCEYQHSTVCTASGDIEYLEGSAVPAFCVNGGTCKDIVSHGTRYVRGNPARSPASSPHIAFSRQDKRVHPGCDCPVMFEGEHCEFHRDQAIFRGGHAGVLQAQRPTRQRKSAGSTVLSLSAVVTVVAALMATFFVVRQRRRIRRRGSTQLNLQRYRRPSIIGPVEIRQPTPPVRDIV